MLANDVESADSDIEENNVSPAGVDIEFCRCIQTLKWNLYQAIVLGPQENTPQAQQNALVQNYVTLLGKLCTFMENALKGRIVDADLRPFPSRLRHEILTCSQWAYRAVKGLSPTDLVSYRDYLTTSLRVYPFVHHMRMLGGADDVETL